jgi:hypothetical protein
VKRETTNPAADGRLRRDRQRRWLVVLAVLALLAFDLARPPSEQISAAVELAAINVYQATLSPRMSGLGVHCRFRPTCSHYAEAVIRQDGALVGTARAALRIARCGPWTPAGTVDPP